MKNILKKGLAVAMALTMALSLPTVSFADAAGEVKDAITADDKTYLALGADLTDEQKNTVLSLLGVNADEIGNYDVLYVTNQDEKNYLSDYISADVIGSKALSSVVVAKKESGHGILVSTKNITYCTTGMYKNALVTAGISDADVIVAGPFPITGTAALVGAMKAYSNITGEKISENSMDTAVDELVTTGELANSLGDSEQAVQLIAYIKQLVIENHLDTEEGIRKVIDEAEKELEVTLTEEEKSEIVRLMDKVNDLDLDVDSLKEQAKQIYDKLEEMDLKNSGLWDKIVNFFTSLFQKITELF